MERACIGRMLILNVLAAVCVACMATTFFGQGIVTGSISGTIEDAQGAMVPAATVQAVRVDTGSKFAAQSDSQGYFEIKTLPIGIYNVTIDAKGFRKLQLSNVLVEAGRNTALGTLRTEIGTSSEVVIVEASTPLIESSSSQIGATFESKVVQTLPHGLGGFDNLALFIPGVVNTGSTNFSNTNGAAIANNGLRGRSNNFQIDGQANNDNSVTGPLVFLSNPDVIAEVQVVSNNFSAEYGRNSGTVVNYITKSGTNTFHGTAGYQYEGNWARSHTNGQKNPLLGFCPQGVAPGTTTPYATKCRATVIPRLVDNRFGGTFGGPVVRNRVWFFGSYQQRKQRAQNQATSSNITPTPAGIATLATAFPGNAAVTALQQFGPFGIKAGNPQPSGTEQMIPVSNGTTQVQVPFAFVSRTVGDNYDDKQITGRGDWQISNKDRFFFRFIYQNSNNALGSGTISSGAFVAVPAEDRQYGWDYTRIWSANFVQQVRVGYGKGFFKFAGGEAFPQCTIENVKACPPNISFFEQGRSYTPFGLATNLPQDRQVHNTQIQSNSTWTHGRHGVKFGGEFSHQNSPNHFLPSINGGFQFFSSPTVGSEPARNAFSQFIRAAASCPPVFPPNTGATFNGICSQVSLTDGRFNFDFKENDLAFYAQDDWRVKDNLTLNLGLRWEWTQQAINLLHDITVKNVADGFWAAGLPTDVTILPKIPEALKNFGPNIGFAWRPRFMKSVLGEDKTVIRGGYRIAYDPAFYNIFLNMATLAPVVNAGTIRNVGVPANATGNTVQAAYLSQIPRGQNPGSRNQTRVSPDFHNPYVQQWSLGMERLVTSRISFDIRYVGNHGVGNFQSINANPLICTGFDSSGACTGGLAGQAPQFIPAGVKSCTPAQAAAGAGRDAIGRTDCKFSAVRTRTNGAWSIYHGLQNELKIRALNGLTANVAYTWSKALDNTSEIFGSNGGNTTPISLNPFDPNRMERGVSAQSYPHVFSTYWLYDLPWMRSQEGLLGHILGGWQFSGTYAYQSGVAVFPAQNTNNGDPYCDAPFNNNFIGGTDSCRPILSNRNAPFNTSGRYVSATQLINISTCQNATLVGTPNCPTISPSDVHFIVNNTSAINALCNGNPFACAVGRNLTRTMPRNNVDLSLQKNFKINERLNFTLRGDALNAFNHQFLGVPGLNVNNKNVNGVACLSPVTGNSCPGSRPAPDTFGETWGNTGTYRTIVISGRISF